MLQIKDIDWLNECKNRTFTYTVYKQITSDLGTYTGWKWEAGKSYSMQIETKRKCER